MLPKRTSCSATCVPPKFLIVKKNGYDNACKAGISIAVSDIKIPKEKQQILADAEKQIDKTERMFRRGLMSEDERYRKVIEIWSQATDDVRRYRKTDERYHG